MNAAGNKARSTARTIAAKGPSKAAISPDGRKSSSATKDSAPMSSSSSAPSIVRRQELHLHSTVSLNASFSSDCSTDSFRSRASTGRIGSVGSTRHRENVRPGLDKGSSKEGSDCDLTSSTRNLQGKKTCSWVTPNVGTLFFLR